jgi:hypothetical protein
VTLTFLLLTVFSVWVGMLSAYFLGKFVGVPGYIVGFLGGFYIGYLLAWMIFRAIGRLLGFDKDDKGKSASAD